MFMAGAGSVIMYDQIKNGNMKKMFKKMKKIDLKAIDDLENMIK